MTVIELINALKDCDEGALISLWHPRTDCETLEVYVDKSGEYIHLSVWQP